VEDDESYALLLGSFLRDEGFEVELAASGKEGLKKALSFAPDLVMLDYHLGDMTGYDVAVGLRHMRNSSRIPFLVLSSVGADPMLLAGFERLPNCRAVLVKSQSTEEIARAVHAVLGGS
jgi:DNA-binding response OmpR family regulator